MFRSSVRFTASFSAFCAVFVCAFSSSELLAQSQTAEMRPDQQAAARQRVALQNQQLIAPQQQVSPKLWKLLDDWAKGSGGIKSLSGKHERHVYDGAFEIEKVSDGRFWYEFPDKGRIDVDAIKISENDLAERNKPEAKVERKQNGQPYELKSDDPERWLCDGEKVYDINDAQKSAKVAHLPPELRGQNIMNSPLPFLFGMPADQAVERFHMKIDKDYRPEYDIVLLSAVPRWRQDAENWKSAQIYLDTKTYLPSAVKLIDPAGTKRTVYKFSDMKIGGGIADFFKKDPWNPRINGYQIHVIQPGQDGSEQPMEPQAIATGGPIMVPNVVGQNHKTAEEMLIKAGIPPENISKQNYGPAPKAEWTYLVRTQEPAANTHFDPATKVVLMIFDRPQQNAGVAPVSGTQQRTGKVSLRQE